jgi:hypothetical protein
MRILRVMGEQCRKDGSGDGEVKLSKKLCGNGRMTSCAGAVSELASVSRTDY